MRRRGNTRVRAGGNPPGHASHRDPSLEVVDGRRVLRPGEVGRGEGEDWHLRLERRIEILAGDQADGVVRTGIAEVGIVRGRKLDATESGQRSGLRIDLVTEDAGPGRRVQVAAGSVDRDVGA